MLAQGWKVLGIALPALLGLLGAIALVVAGERALFWGRYFTRRDPEGRRRATRPGAEEAFRANPSRDPAVQLALGYWSDPARSRELAERLIASSQRGGILLEVVSAGAGLLGLLASFVNSGKLLAAALGVSPFLRVDAGAARLVPAMAGLAVFMVGHGAGGLFRIWGEKLRTELGLLWGACLETPVLAVRELATSLERRPPLAVAFSVHAPVREVAASRTALPARPWKLPSPARLRAARASGNGWKGGAGIHLKGAAVLSACLVISALLHGGVFYLAQRMDSGHAQVPASESDGMFFARLRQVAQAASAFEESLEKTPVPPPKPDPPAPEPPPTPPVENPAAPEAAKPEPAPQPDPPAAPITEQPKAPPAPKEEPKAEPAPLPAPPPPTEAKPAPPAAPEPPAAPPRPKLTETASTPPKPAPESPPPAPAGASDVTLDEAKSPDKSPAAQAPSGGAAAPAGSPALGFGAREGAPRSVEASSGSEGGNAPAAEISTMKEYRRFISREMKSGSSTGQYVPNLRFGDNKGSENRDIMRYFGMELIAYPKNQKFYVYIDPDQGLFSRSNDFAYIRNFSTRAIFRSSPYFDGLRREAARRVGVDPDTLVVAQLLKPSSAAYIGWKESECARRAGIPLEEVDACDASFVASPFGVWIVRIDRFLLRDGRRLAVQDFEWAKLSPDKGGER